MLFTWLCLLSFVYVALLAKLCLLVFVFGGHFGIPWGWRNPLVRLLEHAGTLWGGPADLPFKTLRKNPSGQSLREQQFVDVARSIKMTAAKRPQQLAF